MKKNWRKNIFRGLCLTSVAFVFQACYGTGPDNGYDLYVKGQVVSKNTGLPIKGIRVSTGESRTQYEFTDEEGQFSFYTPTHPSIQLNFEDVDSIENGFYLPKDTLITTDNKKRISVKIELEEKSDEQEI